MAPPFKMSDEQKLALAQDSESGNFNKQDLALKYNVSYQYVCQILRDLLPEAQRQKRAARAPRAQRSPRTDTQEIDIVSALRKNIKRAEQQQTLLTADIRRWEAALTVLENKETANVV